MLNKYNQSRQAIEPDTDRPAIIIFIAILFIVFGAGFGLGAILL